MTYGRVHRPSRCTRSSRVDSTYYRDWPDLTPQGVAGIELALLRVRHRTVSTRDARAVIFREGRIMQQFGEIRHQRFRFGEREIGGTEAIQHRPKPLDPIG